LYSDHEIFLRELISNGTDATLKLKHLISIGEAKVEYGNPFIEVKIDKEAKKIHIIDQGLGMTADEVEKYINQVAFSGAEEFVKKYEGKVDPAAMIGHFGLGFYSAFMVAKTVEIKTKSHTQAADESGAHWMCDGSPEFTLKTLKKNDRGTEIVLNVADDSEDFLEDFKIRELLKKYARFMSVPIQFGEREERTNVAAEGEEPKYETSKVPDIINADAPAWTKKPSELTDEDYKKFYKALYPFSFDEPLFHIHLNVDYPFDLTGILFFPRVKPNMELQRNKIQLYQSQVFVTDNVEGIVPDFLTLLHGVLDSKDIPLNVSRSYLQADGNVKKISGHITKKVADKLEEMFKADRADFESKWNDIKMIIEYGMITYEKLFERAEKFFLVQNTDGGFFNVEASNDSNRVDLFVFGNDERLLLIARLDNLGKGASGAAVQAMNVHLGVEESLGLV
jgi:molecular chaperone HtpG